MSAKNPERGKGLTRESLKKSGLLEQYVLGLTTREQNRILKAFLEDNPDAQEDVEAIKAELGNYMDGYNLGPPDAEREVRTPDDFLDLDHEMILAMTERNHSLTIWRYVLGTLCLLLLVLSGYLFRLSENNKTALLQEKARHAQDDNSHRLKVENLKDAALDWSGLQTVTTYVGEGIIQLHYSPNDDRMILDLSHLNVGKRINEKSYHIYVMDGEDSRHVLEILPADEHHLHALKVAGKHLQVYCGEKEKGATDHNLVAEISLP